MSAAIAADRARTNADARLVALARESRGEALELIYSAYKTRIYSFLLRLLADPVGADDLTQDTFTKAYQALGSLTTDHRVLPWLYRIATNTAIDHLRRKRRFTWLRVGRLAGTGEGPARPDRAPPASALRRWALLLSRIRPRHPPRRGPPAAAGARLQRGPRGPFGGARPRGGRRRASRRATPPRRLPGLPRQSSDLVRADL